MTISGFTIVRNADKYYFPVKASILSILPIVDEFIIALGDNAADDNTREIIESIQSDKIKIFDRIWSEEDFTAGRILAKETNFALSKCTGDWCFYLQADEVVHEKDHPAILHACATHLSDRRVDGLLFDYFHFWGDYDHYLPFHGWYKQEIRIIRNRARIYSIKDAQSFRKDQNKKLRVKPIDAHIYHYGWVRPPYLMQAKKKEQDAMWDGVEKNEAAYRLSPEDYDYGALGKIPLFKGSHPKVMAEFRKKLFWKDKLNYTKKANLRRAKNKHEKWKYRLLSFIENNWLRGHQIGGYSNWEKI